MSATPGRLSELATVLERMAGLYGELTVLANDKVAHMGKGDLAALRTDVAREEALVRKSQEQDGLRRQLLEIIGRGYGIAAQAARRMTASQLLQRLEPAKRWELELAVGRLRTAARELAEANRVAGLVSSQVLSHLHDVFASISRVESAPAGYTPAGRVQRGGSRRIFETTG